MHLPGQIQGTSRAALVAHGLLALLALAIIITKPGALVGIALMAAGVCCLRSMQRARTLTRSKLIGAISVAALGTLTSLSALAPQPRTDIVDSAASPPHFLTALADEEPTSAREDRPMSVSTSASQSDAKEGEERDEPAGDGVPLTRASTHALSATWKEHPDPTAARQLLESLAVKGRAPKTGYSRTRFGQRWADVERNGCDTRNDILARDLTDIRVKPGTRQCVVVSGKLSDPYTGQEISFQKGRIRSKQIQIDHVVALSDAWQKGAQQLDDQRRVEFANDPINLLAVDGPSNQQKGDGDAATWLPTNTAFRCTYVSLQIRVKAKYGLWVTRAEKDAMIRVLDTCTSAPTQISAPAQTATPPASSEVPSEAAASEDSSTQLHGLVSQPQPAPAIDEEPRQPPLSPKPVVEPEPLHEEPISEQPAFEYANCCAVWQERGGPIWAGEPGFHSGLDGDGDGKGCKWRPKNCH